MAKRTEATAAPTPLKIAGKTFLMSPMTDEDMGIMDRWVQSRHLRIARDSLPADADDEQKDRTERCALEQASTMTFMSGAGMLLMEQPEPMALLFWCCIRHNHPDVTPEDIRKLFADAKNYDTLLSEWNRLHNEITSKVKAAVKKKRRKAKPPRRKRKKRRKK